MGSRHNSVEFVREPYGGFDYGTVLSKEITIDAKVVGESMNHLKGEENEVIFRS